MSVTRRGLRFFTLVAISPFSAAVAAFWRPRDIASRNLIWAFTIFYGAVLYIAEDSTADSVRYVEQLQFMHAQGYSFSDLLGEFFTGANSYQDIYQPLLTWIVSLVTSEPWLLFATFGILLGYVYSRSIWFLIDRVPGRASIATVMLITAFALDVSIGLSLNGVRMWTALHVFVYATLHLAAYRKPKFLLLALLTPLIHFSFLLPCSALLAFILVRRFALGIYSFFVGSFLLANLEIGVVRQFLNYLPLTFEERAVTGYVDQLDVNSASIGGTGEVAWFLTLSNSLTALFVFLAGTLLFLGGVHKNKSANSNIALFGMLIYGVTNLIEYIPSAGRFFKIGEILIIASAVIFLNDSDRTVRRYKQLVSGLWPLLGINIALGVRFLLEFASPLLLVGNFFLAPFVDAQIGLYEMIELGM